MKFKLFEGEQRTPEWFEIRRGKVSSSRLGDWLAVSKAKGKEGQPLKARLDYEKELMFERQFNVSYDFFVSEPMQDGIDFEAFARREYERITGNSVAEVGGWYNDKFFSSTDGEVTEKGKKKPGGILEIKWVRDNSWTEVLASHEPSVAHQYQVQGGMLASGHKWCDYVVGHLKTKRLMIIRVEIDPETHKQIEESLKAELSIEPYNLDNTHQFEQAVREYEMEVSANFNVNKKNDLEGF